ncbi:MAG: hypothetical protein KatS3mg053_1961 [Candidatus Roseilinea sp.]|jgi:hypothetical protein|nr:MAG: hypothetical protein KatS3mg053_1961 [Candidatus Roseilinea sp.]
MSKLSTVHHDSSSLQPNTPSRFRRVVVLGVAVAVCLQIAFGFFIFRSPATRSEPARKASYSIGYQSALADVGGRISFRGV